MWNRKLQKKLLWMGFFAEAIQGKWLGGLSYVGGVMINWFFARWEKKGVDIGARPYESMTFQWD